jgi:hypothetical protein
VEVQPLDGNLLGKSVVAHPMLNLDKEVAALVKATEFRGGGGWP